MEQEYYRQYNPNTKKYGDKFTWNEFMYSCYQEIKEGRKTYWVHVSCDNPFEYHAVKSYFSRFGHNDKDGYWKEKEYSWRDRAKYIDKVERVLKPYTVEPRPRDFIKCSVLKVTKIEVKEPATWILKPRIVDSFGRTISSGYLKSCYKKYIPDESHKKKRKPSVYYRARYMWDSGILKGYTFRSGPVPGISGHWHRGRWWHKYKGDHGCTTSEIRSWYRDEIEQKETALEYGTTFKLNSSRTPHLLDRWEWGDHRNAWKGKGWKRTRVEKQWMRGLGKLKPLSD